MLPPRPAAKIKAHELRTKGKAELHAQVRAVTAAGRQTDAATEAAPPRRRLPLHGAAAQRRSPRGWTAALCSSVQQDG